MWAEVVGGGAQRRDERGKEGLRGTERGREGHRERHRERGEGRGTPGQRRGDAGKEETRNE